MADSLRTTGATNERFVGRGNEHGSSSIANLRFTGANQEARTTLGTVAITQVTDAFKFDESFAERRRHRENQQRQLGRNETTRKYSTTSQVSRFPSFLTFQSML